MTTTSSTDALRLSTVALLVVSIFLPTIEEVHSFSLRSPLVISRIRHHGPHVATSTSTTVAAAVLYPQSTTSTTTRLYAVTSGGTRKADDSSQQQQQQQQQQQRWKKKVEAKRPILGHVVPKTSTTRRPQKQQQQQQQRRQVRPQGEYDNDYPRKTKGAPPLKILGGSYRGRKLISPEVHLRPMMGKVREACFSTLTYFDLYNNKPAITTTTGVGGATSKKSLCRHLDIFAGSGSVGLESLSRGATYCTFVDLAPNCCDTITKNLKMIGIDKEEEEDMRAAVIHADALEMLRDPITALQKSWGTSSSIAAGAGAGVGAAGVVTEDHPLLRPYQIVTLCPPYEEIVYADLIDAVCNSPLVTDDTVVLIEYPVELGCLPHVYDLESGGKMIGLRNRRYGRTVVALYIINPTGRLETADSRPEEFVNFE